MVALARDHNRILAIGTTALEASHLFKKAGVLALIANTMSRLDIALRMGAIPGKWHYMIEDQPRRMSISAQRRINVFLADVAMVAVSFQDTVKINLLNCSRTFTCAPPLRGFESHRAKVWFAALVTIISAVIFFVLLIESTKAYTLRQHKCLVILLSILSLLGFTTIDTLMAVPIPLGFIFPKFIQGLFGFATITPFAPWLYRWLVALLTYVLISGTAITAFFACRLMPIISSTIDIELIYGLFGMTFGADFRRGLFMCQGVLQPLNSFQFTLLVPTNLTPRLISASTWGLLVELIKGFVNLTTCTDLGRKQRKLVNSMIYCAHSNGLPVGNCLGYGRVGSTSISKRFNSILSQNSLKSHLAPLSAKRIAGVLCH